ncbi:hypothetical protein CAEBREN_15588 [Caenorhabditis brenneri]|uniref:Uncharacterized protein n=1 Tax=Caenorhabditis brenneri TaxID=135651 RepID=G0P509_CAEBE|nr:hypothetical protein CAEBREN_15588 [Caenorhabditis brenneri]
MTLRTKRIEDLRIAIYGRSPNPTASQLTTLVFVVSFCLIIWKLLNKFDFLRLGAGQVNSCRISTPESQNTERVPKSTKIDEIREIIKDHKEISLPDAYKKEWIQTGYRNIGLPENRDVNPNEDWCNIICKVDKHQASITKNFNPTKEAIEKKLPMRYVTRCSGTVPSPPPAGHALSGQEGKRRKGTRMHQCGGVMS